MDHIQRFLIELNNVIKREKTYESNDIRRHIG